MMGGQERYPFAKLEWQNPSQGARVVQDPLGHERRVGQQERREAKTQEV